MEEREGAFAVRLGEGPQSVGLYDKSRQAFFVASVRECKFSGPGQSLESPDSFKTPEYYRRDKLPAWFCMTSIEVITEQRFIELFG